MRWPSLFCPLRSCDLHSGRLDAVRAKPAPREGPPCPHLPPLASPQKPRARGRLAQDLAPPIGAQQTLLDAIHHQSPGPPRPAPARGAEELCPGGGEVTQVALPDPRTPLPPGPAWLWFSARMDRDRARKPLELGPVSSLQSRLFVLPRHGHGTAQRRPSPLTRPTCLLFVLVKSLIPLPERPESAASQAGSPPPSLPSPI